MNTFADNFVRLQSSDGVGGICAAKGGKVVMNHLPVSDAATASLLKVIDSMLKAYAEVGRDIRRIVFGFDRGVVAMVANGDRRLIAIADGGRTNLDRLMLMMEGFLAGNPEFKVQRPVLKKTVVDESMLTPGSTLDQWGRRVVSLRGLKGSAKKEGRQRLLPPAPEWGKSDRSD